MIHETRIIPITHNRDRICRVHRRRYGRCGRPGKGTPCCRNDGFRTRSVYRNANPDTLRFTERFTRTAPNKVRWSVTVEDPTTWTRPWTFSLPLTMNDAEPIMLYECHEGNYGLRNILSAARAEERAQ